MKKNSGYLVETKSGKQGRTYHSEEPVNNKVIVHVEVNGVDSKLLCDPTTLNIIGHVD